MIETIAGGGSGRSFSGSAGAGEVVVSEHGLEEWLSCSRIMGWYEIIFLWILSSLTFEAEVDDSLVHPFPNATSGILFRDTVGDSCWM